MAEGSFKVGDRVVHPTFGEGLVLSVLGTGHDLMYRVSFSRDGVQRKLRASLARLAPPVDPASSGR